MSAGVPLTWMSRIQQLFPKQDRRLLLLSIVLQLILGLLFGHVYDMRIYMATGYLVATGQDPYIPQNLSAVFHNPAFQGMTTIGYPPPWPLVLGLIYRLTYGLVPNFLLYNLAIKLPIIAANLGLAYLVAHVLKKLGADTAVSRRAWIFLLFNPFLLYFTTAWGQFDSLVALLTLSALLLLHNRKTALSAVLLALAISLKPTPVAVVLVVMVYLWGKPWHRLVLFLAAFTASIFLFCVAPFIIFGWDASPILLHWNAQFTVSGGMSLMTFYELVKDTYTLPGMWWLLGLVWLPAIVLGALVMSRGVHDLVDLLKKSLALILIFFLTRTWLSEPNLTLILPIVLILTEMGELPKLTLAAVWILPLIFTVFNTSPPQLLFPILPQLMDKLLQLMDVHRTARLVARTIVVIPWLVAGWWMVVRGYKKSLSATVWK
jgi:uncharacterized membrane protein